MSMRSLPFLLLISSLPLINSDCSRLTRRPARTDICKVCEELPEHLLECDEVLDLSEYNKSDKDAYHYGCSKMGGESISEIEMTRVVCKSLDPFTCWYDQDSESIPNDNKTGLIKQEWIQNRYFLSEFKKPCVRYTGHYFQSTLIYSILLGFLGVDRFCLGWTGIGVGKMLTVGGLGIWWVIDIILLITGNLTPNDKSNWENLY